MKHLEEGTLQAFLDSELDAQRRAEVMRHLASCPACAADLEVLRSAAETLTAVLGGIDRAPQVDAAYAAVRSAAPHRRFVPRVGLSGSRPESGAAAGARRALLRAALLVLGLAAAASAAIPGSPLRQWLSDAWQRVAGMDAPTPTAPAPETPKPPEELAGISILPHAGEVRILVQAPAPDCRIRVRLVDGEQAAVYTAGAAGGARFQTAPGRILVTEAGPGEIRIELPRTARIAVVAVDGRELVVMETRSLRPVAPTLDATDTELVFRAGI